MLTDEYGCRQRVDDVDQGTGFQRLREVLRQTCFDLTGVELGFF